MAPKAFDDCRAKGGNITTESVGKRAFRHVCWIDGKRHAGYLKRRKSKTAQALKARRAR